MNVLNNLTDVAPKQIVPTLQDHITVSVKLDTRETEKIAQVLMSSPIQRREAPFRA